MNSKKGTIIAIVVSLLIAILFIGFIIGFIVNNNNKKIEKENKVKEKEEELTEMTKSRVINYLKDKYGFEPDEINGEVKQYSYVEGFSKVEGFPTSVDYKCEYNGKKFSVTTNTSALKTNCTDSYQSQEISEAVEAELMKLIGDKSFEAHSGLSESRHYEEYYDGTNLLSVISDISLESTIFVKDEDLKSLDLSVLKDTFGKGSFTIYNCSDITTINNEYANVVSYMEYSASKDDKTGTYRTKSIEKFDDMVISICDEGEYSIKETNETFSLLGELETNYTANEAVSKGYEIDLSNYESRGVHSRMIVYYENTIGITEKNRSQYRLASYQGDRDGNYVYLTEDGKYAYGYITPYTTSDRLKFVLVKGEEH